MSITSAPAPVRYGAMDDNGNGSASDGDLFPRGSSAPTPLTFASRLSHDGNGHANDTNASNIINANSIAARRSARFAIVGMLVVACIVGIGFFAAFTYGGDSSSSSSVSSLTAAANHASPLSPSHVSSSTPNDKATAADAIAQHNAAMGVTSTSLGDEYVIHPRPTSNPSILHSSIIFIPFK
jgi:hypothetical protein